MTADLLILTIVLIVITIGVVILRALYQNQRATAAKHSSGFCPDCGLRIPPQESRCLRCGWGLSTVKPRPQRVLEQLQRHLNVLEKRELLTPEATQQLRATLDGELQRLAAQPAMVTPGKKLAATPATPAPVSISLDTAAAVLSPVPPPGSTSVATAVPRPTVVEPSIPEASPVHLEVAKPGPDADHHPDSPLSITAVRQDDVPKAKTDATELTWVDEPPAEAARPSTPAPPLPRKQDWLLAFMEQRNLNWGELIGGLLIVCGSIALVISFWSQIANSPFLKFVVFNGFTAALFAVGRYAGQRLQLPSTSRAFYAIGSLLIPLNFLAIAAFTRGATTDAMTLVGEVITTLLFGWLCWRAGTVLASSQPTAFALGVIGPSLANLVLGRVQISGSQPLTVFLWGLLPTVPYLAAHILQARTSALPSTLSATTGADDSSKSPPVAPERDGPSQGWWSLATSTLAVLVAFGLMLYRSDQVLQLRHSLAPLFPLLALPCLSQGLRRGRVDEQGRSSLEAFAASAIGFSAMGGIGLGLVLAWPWAGQVLLTAMVGALVFAIVAVWQKRPALWLAVLPGLTIAWLLALGMFQGKVTWQERTMAPLFSVFTAPETGNALIPLVLTTLMGGAFLRRRFPQDARWLLVGTGVLASLSLFSILLFGFGRAGDQGGSTGSLLLYGSLALLAAVVLEQPRRISPDSDILSATSATTVPINAVATPLCLAGVGMFLLILASIQGLFYRWPGSVQYPHSAAMLLASSLITLFFAVLRNPWQQRITGLCFQDGSRLPSLLTIATITLSGLALGGVALDFFRIPLGGLAWQVLWSAGLWLALALIRRSDSNWARPIFSGFQLLLAVASLCVARQWLQSHPWSDPAPWLGRDPRTWQLLGIILSLQALVWLLLRAVTSRRKSSPPFTSLNQLLDHPTRSGDRMLAHLALLGVLAVSAYSALPGSERELTPRHVALTLSSQESIAQAQLAHEQGQQASRARGEPESTKPFRVVPPLTAFEWHQTPHAAAGEWGTWIWLGLVLWVWLGWQRHWPAWPTSIGWGLALAAICPLVASHWDSDVATASAWRWTAAVWLTVVAGLVWTSRLGQPADSTRWFSQQLFDFAPGGQRLANFSQGVMLGLCALLGLLVGKQLTHQPGLWEPWRHTLNITGWLAVATALLGLLLQLPAIVMTRMALQKNPLAEPPRLVQRFSSPMTLASWLTWILGIGPLMAVVLFILNGALRGNPLVGPEPGTFFHQIGIAANYAAPLIVWALVLIGHAICFTEGAYVFGAGLLLQISTTSIVAFLAARAGRPLDQALALELVLWNSLVASLAAIGWQGGRRWLGLTAPVPEASQGSESGWNRPALPPLLITQCLLGLSLWMICQIPMVWSMSLLRDGIAAQSVFQSPLAWISWGLALGAIAQPLDWRSLRTGHLWRTLVCGTGALLLAHSLAQRFVSLGIAPWPLLRISLIVGAVVLWLLEMALRQRAATLTGETPRTRVPGVAVLGFLALMLILVETIGSGGKPSATWELRALGGLILLHVLWSHDRRWLWGSAVLLPAAEVCRWLTTRPAGLSDFTLLLHRGDAIWLSLLPTAMVSLWQEPGSSSSSRTNDNERESVELELVCFHRGVGWLGVAWFAVTLVLEAIAGGLSAVVPASHLWIQIGLVTLWMLCLRDGRRQMTLLPLYLSGLLLFASLPGVLIQEIRWRLTFQGQVMAGYTALSLLFWWRRQDYDPVAEKLGIIPFHRDARRNRIWLARATQFVSTLVLVITFMTVWTAVPTATEPLRRVQMATAAWTPIIVLALLCRSTDDGRMQGRTLRRAAFASIFWAWAWFPLNWLLVRFSVQAAALLLLALVLSQLASHWSRLGDTWRTAIQKILPWLMGIGLATSLFIIWLEAITLPPAQTREEYVAVAIVAGALVLFAGLCLAAALIPGRDPLRLDESRKTLWVYASEGLLTLLFLHFRLSLPWLFTGIFQAYWPFFVLALAFVGLGLAELFRRQNRPVLAEPLENTGMWLPLLPLLGFWLNPSTGQASLSMLLGGLFYGALSIRRKSVALGLLAALAVNGALWWQFQHIDGYRLLQHPQLWFIPFALCLLAASWIHRDQLAPKQQATLRHLSATLIYTSSTIDIFLNGLAEKPWLAVVLAGLSVLGVLAGMLLRVRSFLFQGTAFLCVSLLTLLWHAAFHLHQTWLIWLTVIFAGVAILTLFALFERKRQQMIELVGQLREWSD